MGLNSRIYFHIFLSFNAILFLAFQGFQAFSAYRTREALIEFQKNQASQAGRDALELTSHPLFESSVNTEKNTLSWSWFVREVGRIEKTYYLQGLWFSGESNEYFSLHGDRLENLNLNQLPEGMYHFQNEERGVIIAFSLELPELFQAQKNTQQVGVVLISILFILVMFTVRVLFRRTEKLQEELVSSSRLVEFGRLAAGVAHDVRNPLGAMNLMVEELKDLHPLDMETQDCLKQIGKEISRINHTLGTLLVFQKENLPLNQKVDLQELVLDVISLFPNDKDLIRYKKGNGPLTMWGNRDLLFRMLENLVRNALESGAKTPVVEIQLEKKPEGITLVVLDNGLGLSDWKTAVSPFYTTKNYGTGLGLVVVQDAVERHRGRIKVEMIEPNGTRLTLCFPFDTVPEIG